MHQGYQPPPIERPDTVYYDGDQVDQYHAAIVIDNTGRLVRTFVNERGTRVTEPVNNQTHTR